MQPGHPGYPFRQPLTGPHPAPLIHQLHVMMIPDLTVLCALLSTIPVKGAPVGRVSDGASRHP
jgi:hypothetical protein